MVITVLHPDQFQVNEAWIAFQLNDAPMPSQSGDVNFLALMDAASCFILASAVVLANPAQPSEMEARRLLKTSYAHKQEMAQVLFIPAELHVDTLALEAQRHNIRIFRIPEEELLVFIGPAKEGFREDFRKQFRKGNAP